MTIQKATVQDIINTIKEDRSTPRFAVLLGAGASITAGVPLAGEMVKELKERIYKRNTGNNRASEEEIEDWVKQQEWYKCIPQEQLEDKEYNAVFYQYSNNRPDRQKYVAECVRMAEVPNWTHIYLANLVKNERIQTILTTNFDGLAFKALFSQGREVVTCHHPDHARGISFSGGYKLIMHLHGHYLHYDIRNTEKEVKKLSPEFIELFKNVAREKGLIVVGYKGRKEYVTELLLNFTSENLFRYNLYWVTNGTEETLSDPAKRLLEYQYSYLIENCDADTFFLNLNHGQNLGFPPYLQDPLDDLIKSLKPLGNLKLLKAKELSSTTHGWLADKIDRLETFHREEKGKEEAKESVSEFLLLYEQGRIEEAKKQLISATEKYKKDAYLYYAYGTLLLEQGGEENIRQSLEKYQLAVKYRHDYHKAYNNWGIALYDLGTIVGGDEGRDFIRQSFEKYRLTTEYKPDDHEAYNNWGVALYDLGKIVGGDEGQDLIRQSFEKYELATKYKRDYHEAYYNWGIALSDLGKMVSGDEGQDLMRQSFEKYELATKYKRDYHEAYYNWGTALSDLGKMVSGDEGQDLMRQSFEKYELATKYKRDKHEAYNNWGAALSDLGKMVSGDEGQDLIRQSFGKYELATKYKPDYHAAYNNWGIATQKLADLLPPEEKEEKEALKKQAEELFRKAKDLREKSE
ncbi:MAG: SIR2 family protein [Candidatus Brocadiales bacterium]|nr:SIR2 family protein [Candidatus Bathyanammoxibius sp.]